MANPTANDSDTRAYLSVAVSFGDVDALKRLGSDAYPLTCPECGANGTRFGSPGSDVRFEGFAPLTRGGTVAILASCDSCKKSVTLPHAR